jgi:hypothetical protein
MVRSVSNAEIAAILDRVADLLEVQGASPWRVRAYRAGAETCARMRRPLAELAKGGVRVLDTLPAIGPTIAAHIREIVARGRLGFLERLQGQVSPEDLFATLPGVGETLATRIHRELGVETLEQLEQAAFDGRLAALAGVGPRRAQGLRDSLARVLGDSARRRAARSAREHGDLRPSVATRLAVDRAYREGARAGRLPRITPRRFNPERADWLPVLHEERDGWTFTALFSNTARAHELGRTDDWVILHAERDGDERRFTVVTETHGPLAGARVVRGREDECAALPRPPAADREGRRAASAETGALAACRS